MAVTSNKFNWNPNPWRDGIENFDDVKDYAIQGQLFQATFELSDVQVIAGTFTENDIKKELANKLVYELMKSKHIEFTKVPNLINNSHTFRARIFAVPDNNVRILREKNLI